MIACVPIDVVGWTLFGACLGLAVAWLLLAIHTAVNRGR